MAGGNLQLHFRKPAWTQQKHGSFSKGHSSEENDWISSHQQTVSPASFLDLIQRQIITLVNYSEILSLTYWQSKSILAGVWWKAHTYTESALPISRLKIILKNLVRLNIKGKESWSCERLHPVFGKHSAQIMPLQLIDAYKKKNWQINHVALWQ